MTLQDERDYLSLEMNILRLEVNYVDLKARIIRAQVRDSYMTTEEREVAWNTRIKLMDTT